MINKKFLGPSVSIGDVKTFSVYGKSFFDISGLFLSGSVFDNNTFFNPFSASPKLSAQYPGFSGIKLNTDAYQYNNDNTLTFTMPSASSPGYVDVILMNGAGWGKLTQFVIKDTINPFISGSNLYNNFEPYQRPWKNGILIEGTIILTPTVTESETPTPTPTESETPTPTPTNTPTETPTPTPTVTESETPTPTESLTPTPTVTPTVTETQGNTPTPTPTESETPTPTPTVTESETPTPTPTVTESETPTPTPTVTESETPTPTPTVTESETPTPTPTETPTPTPN